MAFERVRISRIGTSLDRGRNVRKKEQLNVPGKKGATLLGLPWDKENDTVGVSFPQEKAHPSKRGMFHLNLVKNFVF